MSIAPIITVIGYSNAGKTHCVSKLVKELTKRGYRIATAKHCHQGFDLDVEGKDSWKHKQAGASTTIMSSRDRLAVISDLSEPPSLEQLNRQYAHGADLLLAEGYSWEPYPKILVMSKETLAEEHVPAPQLLIAVVRDRPVETGLPQFSFSEFKLLANFIEESFLQPSQPNCRNLSA
jgi:molybdopterin-guanine dinucleotide biosynthesis protein B